MTAYSIELIMEILDRAGHRCECTSQCGESHPGRCTVNNNGPKTHRLVVAPTTPGGPAVRDLSLPASKLQAWCATCLTKAEQLARRHA